MQRPTGFVSCDWTVLVRVFDKSVLCSFLKKGTFQLEQLYAQHNREKAYSLISGFLNIVTKNIQFRLFVSQTVIFITRS